MAITDYVDMVPSRFGPRFAAKPETIADAFRHDPALGASMVQQRIALKTRDAAFGSPPAQQITKAPKSPKSPGSSDAEGDERVVAELPPPPPDCHYAVETRGETTVVVIEAGPPIGPYDDPATGDGRIDPKLRAMNDAARRHWRDRGNQGPDIQKTVVVLPPPSDGYRYVTRTSSVSGMVEILLIGPSAGDEILGVAPPGSAPFRSAQGAQPSQEKINGNSAVNSRDRARSAGQIRSINAANKAFWSRGR